MLQPNIDTRLEEFELPAKLVTRLKICKAHTFGDIMKIDAAEWTTVTPKVVNALKRFQNAYKKHYKKLTGEIVDDDSTETIETSYMKKDQNSEAPSDERRFFVANNILNAYASAGKLYGDRPLQEVMREIVNAADAFMDAFNGKKTKQQNSRRRQKVETMMNEDQEATEAEIQPPIGEIPIVDGLLVVMDTPAKKEQVINDETSSTPEPVAENQAVAQDDIAADEFESTTTEMPELESDTVEEHEALPAPEAVQISESVELPEVVEVPEDMEMSEDMTVSEAVAEPEIMADSEIKVEEAPTAEVTEEVKADEGVEDPAHPKVTPGDIIVLTAYHGRRPSTSRNFQLGSVIKIESTHIDQIGVLQLRGFCGRKPANIDATRWDWVVCSNIDEAQALSSTIIPAPKPKTTAIEASKADPESDLREQSTPELPVAEEVAAPAAEEPELPVAEEVAAPTAEVPELPVAEEVAVPAAEVPELPIAEEVAAPAAEEPELPVAEEVTAPAAEEPELPIAEEVAAPAAEEPELPIAEEVTAPAAEEPELPIAEKVAAPAAEEPELPIAEEIAAPTLPIEEPQPIVEEPAPADTYPQQHRKNDLSGVPQLFDLFLTEEEENAGLPF